MNTQLLLASSSPRRRELLTLAGIPFSIAKFDFIELTHRLNPALAPGQLAACNALGKALAAQSRRPRSVILAADTVVSLGSRIFEKPVDLEEAASFLQALSGRVHLVTTAVALAFPRTGIHTRLTTTEVKFLKLSAVRIREYLRSIPVLDKAGGYAIQGDGGAIVDSVRGSISNVIGLPLETLSQMLPRAGG